MVLYCLAKVLIRDGAALVQELEWAFENKFPKIQWGNTRGLSGFFCDKSSSPLYGWLYTTVFVHIK